MRIEDTTLDPKVFGERIRQARERLGISQEELARLISKDQAAISEYENGKRKLSAVDLPALAEVLEVPLLYFYEGEVTLYDLDHAILDSFHRLSNPEVKMAVVRFLETLADTL